jgi:soluble lytic murein transglycosylase-like protein
MSSPLVQALLMGQGGGVQDPATLRALQRTGLAQSMLQQGMDGSPAYPGQALGRLAQSIAGAFMMNQGMGDLEQVGKDRESGAQAAQQFLMGGGNIQPSAPTATAVAPQQAPMPQAIPPRGVGGPGSNAQMPPEYLDHFRAASAETGIPMDMLIAQARQESSFNPNARGRAGEIGLMQIMPSTAQSPGFGVAGVDPATLNDPAANIMFGARYLKGRMGGGDPNDPRVQTAGLTAYNGGGDPNYAANVNRYRPGMSPTDPNAGVTAYTPGQGQPPRGVAARTGGVDVAGPGGAPSGGTPPTTQGGAPPAQSGSYETPEIKRAQEMIRRGEQVMSDPAYRYNPDAQKMGKAWVERGERELRLATHVADRQESARVRTEDRQLRRQEKSEDQGYERSQRVYPTVQLTDKDGKVGVYEQRPGEPPRRIGDAARQPGEGTGPFGGTGMDAQVMNTLLSLGQKIKDGVETEAERNQYALAHGHLSRGSTQLVPDPERPGNMMLAHVPGVVPPNFPAPDFRPAPAAPPQQAAPQAQPEQAPAAPPILDGRGNQYNPATQEWTPVGAPQAPAPQPQVPPQVQPPQSAPPAAVQAPNGMPPAPGTPIPVPGTSRSPSDQKLTEAERTAANYALRMRESMKDIDSFEDKGIHTGNVVGSVASNFGAVGRWMQSPDFQVYRQRADDWVRAKLRKESGAVIGADEMQKEYETYFPQVNDSPEKIAAKRRSRQTALLGVDEESGRARIDSSKLPPDQRDDKPAGLPPLPPGFKLVE